MRIYKAFPAYSNYLNIYHKRDPSLTLKPFDVQLQCLKDDFFPWVLSWSQFNVDDSVEVFETIHNDYYLQQAWGQFKWESEIEWEKRIVLEQINRIKPDVCVIYPPELFRDDFVASIRELLKNKVVVGGYDGMNRKNIDLYKGYDFVITCSRYICEYYRANGMPTFALEFGFDPKVLSKIHSSRHTYPVSFSGSIFEGIHDERFRLLDYLLSSRIDLTISSSFEYEHHYSLFSRKMLRSIKNNSFSDFYSHYRLHHHNIGPLYGREMYQFLRDSKTTINLHGDQIDFAANVRLYEATGVGTCLLTDWKKNISDIFDPGKEIITFKTKEEAYDKLLFLGKHDSFRKSIAERAQKRTLSDYSYEKRIPEVIKFIKQF